MESETFQSFSFQKQRNLGNSRRLSCKFEEREYYALPQSKRTNRKEYW